ncbi:MAG: hypothetical protein CMN54_01720 [SAR324 cluster bacterium]|uniref:Uncharacterized protein n=1 Tax=SAR324 cluster bacterium TaxID=2024889 RepID=A0A2D6YG89_9DELT|nr:hypothetical protein [SAR324 cluster bacterium]
MKVCALPHSNEVNKACQKFLSEFFKVPQSDMVLPIGAKSLAKHFLIRRASREIVLKLINSLV